MKTLLFLLALTSCAFTKDILLTQNKCGTHLSLFSLQYLTKRPIERFDNGPFKMETGLETDNNYQSIYHTHVYQDVLVTSENDRIIFQIRDPKEVLLRFFGYFYSKHLMDILLYDIPYDPEETFIFPKDQFQKKHQIQSALDYIRHIRNMYKFYHELDPNKGILVRYEELLTSPRKFFTKILRHIKWTDEKLDSYINNIDTLKSQCKNAYVNQFDYNPLIAVNSDGETIDYYSAKYSEEDILCLKKALIAFFGKDLSPYIKWAEEF